MHTNHFWVTLRNTLKTNRALIIGVFLSIGLISAAFFSYLAAQSRQKIESKLMEEAEAALAIVNGTIHRAQAVLLTVAQSYAIRDEDHGKATEFLNRVSAQFPDIEAFAVADLEGNIYADSTLGFRVNISQRSYFQGALQKKGLYISDGLLSLVHGRPIIAVSVPVTKNGQITGVAYAIIPLDSLNKKLSQMSLGEKENLYLIDSRGVALAHPNREFIGSQRILGDILQIKGTMGKQKGTISSFASGEKTGKLYAYLPVPNTDWALVIDTPLTQVYTILLAELLPPFILFLVLITPTLFIVWLFLLKMGEQQKQLKASNDVLARLAITDGLTGLYNHRFFQEKMEEAVDQARETNQPVSLILLDIDYFKHFNDTYGHLAGDTVLKELARVFTALVGDDGLVARYGGEEFAIILMGKGSQEALALAETIRTTVENHPFEAIGGLTRGKVTLSIGLASFPEHATKKEDLVRLADQALYKAKFSAKNKVEVYYSVLDDLKTYLSECEQNLLSSIKTLITVINAKDRYTYGHSERVVDLAVALGQRLGLDREQLDIIKYGAFIHDIGKIEIDREILNKPGPLTREEFLVIKEHPVIGAEIVQPIDLLKKAIPIILYHHERYDGTGYPKGLKGDDIPLMARIVAVADSFDAMTTDRPYKKAKSTTEALQELRNCSGSQFDPRITEAFIEMIVRDDEEKVNRVVSIG